MNAWRDIIISHINYGTNKGHNVGMYIPTLITYNELWIELVPKGAIFVE